MFFSMRFVLGDLIDHRTSWLRLPDRSLREVFVGFSSQSAQKQLDGFWKAARPVFLRIVRDVIRFEIPPLELNSRAGRQG